MGRQGDVDADGQLFDHVVGPETPMPQNQDASASCWYCTRPLALRADLNPTNVILKKRLQGHLLGDRVDPRLVLVEVWRHDHVLALRLVQELAEDERSVRDKLLYQAHQLEHNS